MNSFLDRLKLRPGEKRLVVFAAFVVFVVLNFFFVVPHFGDLGKTLVQKAATQKSLDTYQAEIKRRPEYEARRQQLEGSGESVLSADQDLKLINDIRNQATSSGVSILNQEQPREKTGGKPTDFFKELSVTIRVNTGDKELVDFLVKLGSGNSTIRVRNLTLNPDAGNTRLAGSLTLVASYQKEPVAQSAKLTNK